MCKPSTESTEGQISLFKTSTSYKYYRNADVSTMQFGLNFGHTAKVRADIVHREVHSVTVRATKIPKYRSYSNIKKTEYYTRWLYCHAISYKSIILKLFRNFAIQMAECFSFHY